MSYDHSTGRVILGVCTKSASSSESVNGLGAGKQLNCNSTLDLQRTDLNAKRNLCEDLNFDDEIGDWTWMLLLNAESNLR